MSVDKKQLRLTEVNYQSARFSDDNEENNTDRLSRSVVSRTSRKHHHMKTKETFDDGDNMSNIGDENLRLKDKCKSYKNEVERLTQMYDEEVKKLRIRIKTLESGIKRVDL